MRDVRAMYAAISIVRCTRGYMTIRQLRCDAIFSSWVMGELSDKGVDKRADADKYKHGLVPVGAEYVDGEVQEFLRKDGNWQSITEDLSRVNGHIISQHNGGNDIGSTASEFRELFLSRIQISNEINFGSFKMTNNEIGDTTNRLAWAYIKNVNLKFLEPEHGASDVNMGTAQNKFNTLHINTILCGGTVAGSHGNFTTLNVSGVLEIPNLTVETEFLVGGSFLPVDGVNINIGTHSNTFNVGYFNSLITATLQTGTFHINAGGNFIPSLPGGSGNLPTSEIGSW